METVRMVTRNAVGLDVTFNYFPAIHGRKEKGSGIPMEPVAPAIIEILKIGLDGNNVTDLLQHLHAGIEDELLEHMANEN